jgi:hypothetical protein
MHALFDEKIGTSHFFEVSLETFWRQCQSWERVSWQELGDHRGRSTVVYLSPPPSYKCGGELWTLHPPPLSSPYEVLLCCRPPSTESTYHVVY